MSWCDGNHTTDTGACLIQVDLVDDDGDASALLTLAGTPCASQRLTIAGDVVTPQGLAQLIEHLAQLGEPLAEGLTDVDCDAHPELHDFTEDDDPDGDDDEVGCDGCGTTTESMQLVERDETTGEETWLCRVCCAARGITYGPRG